MNSAEHYAEAERLIIEKGNDGQKERWRNLAGVHATLALIGLLAEMSLEGDRNPLGDLLEGPAPLRPVDAWREALGLAEPDSAGG